MKRRRKLLMLGAFIPLFALAAMSEAKDSDCPAWAATAFAAKPAAIADFEKKGYEASTQNVAETAGVLEVPQLRRRVVVTTHSELLNELLNEAFASARPQHAVNVDKEARNKAGPLVPRSNLCVFRLDKLALMYNTSWSTAALDSTVQRE